MATDQEFMSFVCDQMKDAGEISCRKMFGECALYKGEKVVDLICDNQLFVKPTTGGKALLARPTERPPYPGAKPFYLIEEALDDSEFLCKLITITEREVRAPNRAGSKTGRKTVKKS